jgi:phage-related tail protein
MESVAPTHYTDEQLAQTVTKLLDKAGKDPRLTPRLLREKAEQRLTLTKGELKPQRERIKNIICEWWQKQRNAQAEKETVALKAVSLHWSMLPYPGTVEGLKTVVGYSSLNWPEYQEMFLLH